MDVHLLDLAARRVEGSIGVQIVVVVFFPLVDSTAVVGSVIDPSAATSRRTGEATGERGN